MIEKMQFLSITGVKNDLDRVINDYVSRYDIQIEDTLVELKNVKGLLPYTDTNPYKETLDKALEIKKYLNIKDEDEEKLLDLKLDIQTVAKSVDDLYEEFQALERSKVYIEEKKAKFNDKLSKVKQFIGLKYDVSTILHFDAIRFRFGRIDKEYYEKLMEYSYDDIDSIFCKCQEVDNYVWGVYFVPTSIAKKVDAIYSSMHFERFFLPEGYKGTPMQASQKLKEKINHCDLALNSIEDKRNELLLKHKDEFIKAFFKLEAYNKNFNIRKLAACTKSSSKSFYILCGWMTAKDAKKFQEEISNDPDIYCIVEKDHSNISSDPPTLLKNNKLFSPFELFVEMYGLPNYKELDPTVIIGITYSILFGIMFGDVGQGFLLMLGAGIIAHKKKSKFAAIISRCGLFSMIFGFLFGSIFGFEHTIPALWLRPAQAMSKLPVIGNLNTIFIFAIIIGMGLILLTMVFNIVNHLRVRNKGEAIFDHNGVAGLVFYGFAVLNIYLIMIDKVLVAGIVSLCVFVIPMILIFFKEPICHFIEKKKEIFPEEKGMFVIQGLFEIFEVLLSYFSNTLSFVRVGAFAVSHAAMMEVVLMLSGMEAGNPNWLVIIFGNLFVMGMEGLIVGIQVLRLEYYELFSRFYRGNGHAFVPYEKHKIK